MEGSSRLWTIRPKCSSESQTNVQGKAADSIHLFFSYLVCSTAYMLTHSNLRQSMVIWRTLAEGARNYTTPSAARMVGEIYSTVRYNL